MATVPGRQLDEAHYAMSHKEIADRIGVKQQTVWKIEQRALRKVRKAFEALGFSERSVYELLADAFEVDGKGVKLTLTKPTNNVTY